MHEGIDTGIRVGYWLWSLIITSLSPPPLIYLTELAEHLISIILDDEIYNRLRSAARATALEWDLANVSGHLEELLYSATAAGKELLGLRMHPLVAHTTREVCLEAIAVAVDAASAPTKA